MKGITAAVMVAGLYLFCRILSLRRWSTGRNDKKRHDNGLQRKREVPGSLQGAETLPGKS